MPDSCALPPTETDRITVQEPAVAGTPIQPGGSPVHPPEGEGAT